jgi:hypothetical protein
MGIGVTLSLISYPWRDEGSDPTALFEAAHTTRAIHRYRDEPVTDKKIMTRIRAAA